MKLNSAKTLNEQEEQPQSVYVISNTNALQYDWIQPKVDLGASPSSVVDIVDGIYVRTTPDAGIDALLILNVNELDSFLDQMANDVEIQREIQAIQEEFASTELDGLTDEQ